MHTKVGVLASSLYVLIMLKCLKGNFTQQAAGSQMSETCCCAFLAQAVAVMNQLAVELDIVPALDNVRNVVLELLGCERVTLFLVDNQTKELRYFPSLNHT